MPILIALFASLGLSKGVSRVLGFVVPVALAVALVGGGWALWKHQHDKHLIEQHDAEQAAKVNAAELQAERTAEANDAVRQQERQAQTKDLNDARDEAIRSNPDEAAKTAGPSTRSVLASLRTDAARHQHSAASKVQPGR